MYFILIILASAYEDKVLGHSVTGLVFKSIKGMTFPQFIDHVLSDIKTPQSEHWRPQFINCNYCTINYDMIGRVETLKKDLEYISYVNYMKYFTSREEQLTVNPSGVNGSIKTKTNPQYNKSKRKSTTEEKANKYFSTLNSTQLDNLYELYQLDFELFDYSVYPYVSDAIS